MSIVYLVTGDCLIADVQRCAVLADIAIDTRERVVDSSWLIELFLLDLTLHVNNLLDHLVAAHHQIIELQTFIRHALLLVQSVVVQQPGNLLSCSQIMLIQHHRIQQNLPTIKRVLFQSSFQLERDQHLHSFIGSTQFCDLALKNSIDYPNKPILIRI